MPIATISHKASRSLLQHAPVLSFSLAGTAVVLLALGPIGWRAGWWHFRFSLLTLMPWAASTSLPGHFPPSQVRIAGSPGRSTRFCRQRTEFGPGERAGRP